MVRDTVQHSIGVWGRDEIGDGGRGAAVAHDGGRRQLGVAMGRWRQVLQRSGVEGGRRGVRDCGRGRIRRAGPHDSKLRARVGSLDVGRQGAAWGGWRRGARGRRGGVRAGGGCRSAGGYRELGEEAGRQGGHGCEGGCCQRADCRRRGDWRRPRHRSRRRRGGGGCDRRRRDGGPIRGGRVLRAAPRRRPS